MVDQSSVAEDRLLDLLDRLRKLAPGPPPLVEGVGLTPPQITLLDWVARSPGSGVQELAARLGLAPPTVSVGVRRLEEMGLLRRQPNPQDGRSIRLFLTPRGQAAQQHLRDHRRQKVRRLLAGLEPREQERLLDLLERALGAAEAATSDDLLRNG